MPAFVRYVPLTRVYEQAAPHWLSLYKLGGVPGRHFTFYTSVMFYPQADKTLPPIQVTYGDAVWHRHYADPFVFMGLVRTLPKRSGPEMSVPTPRANSSY